MFGLIFRGRKRCMSNSTELKKKRMCTWAQRTSTKRAGKCRMKTLRALRANELLVNEILTSCTIIMYFVVFYRLLPLTIFFLYAAVCVSGWFFLLFYYLSTQECLTFDNFCSFLVANELNLIESNFRLFSPNSCNRFESRSPMIVVRLFNFWFWCLWCVCGFMYRFFLCFSVQIETLNSIQSQNCISVSL